MNTTDRWIVEFRTELEKRQVPNHRIDDEVDTVREHIREAGDDADAAFGDPVAYAATLADPADDDAPGGFPILVLLAVIAFFILFTITGTGWVSGDTGMATWAILSGSALLISAAAMSISLFQRAVSAALRDNLTRQTNAQWRLASAVLLLLPWTFIGFAGLILSVTALR
ncbi:hypothetical protein [Paeniglutamicibacter sp. NPDC091659]|uniref:hypothetical protein n=1 Tax=Paeniglutamicibacter sp. NPDC091659 TaxID=3364389 RepID=UPI00381C787B